MNTQNYWSIVFGGDSWQELLNHKPPILAERAILNPFPDLGTLRKQKLAETITKWEQVDVLDCFLECEDDKSE